MTAPVQDKSKLRVRTPKAILSFPHLFKAVPGPDGGEAKFSATFVFPEGTDLTEMKAAAQAAGIARFGDGFAAGVRSGKYKWPFRTDVEDKGYPKGSTFVGARSANAPGLVSRYAGADGKALPITEASQQPGNRDELYPGCVVHASLNAFAFEKGGSKGVSFGLNNLQKLDEGTRLDNRRTAQADFPADLSEPVAPLDDLL